MVVNRALRNQSDLSQVANPLKLSWGHFFIVDDNFVVISATSNGSCEIDSLDEGRNDYPFTFMTEASVNLAEH